MGQVQREAPLPRTRVHTPASEDAWKPPHPGPWLGGLLRGTESYFQTGANSEGFAEPLDTSCERYEHLKIDIHLLAVWNARYAPMASLISSDA